MRLRIAESTREALYALARDGMPREVVGLLVGRERHTVDSIVPLPNAGEGLTFAVDPRDQFLAERRIEAAGLSIVATYHSHPEGGTAPSPTDVDVLGGWACPHVVIAVARDARPDELGAFRVAAGEVEEVELEPAVT